MTGDSIASREGAAPLPFRDTADYSARTTPLRVSIGSGPASLGDFNLDGEDLNRDGLTRRNATSSATTSRS